MVAPDTVRALPIFANLDEAQVEALARISTMRAYERGACVFHEGEPLPPYFLVLVSGSLQIVKLAACGKESVMRLIPPGEPFAWAALLASGIAPASARAMSPLRVLYIPQDDMVALLTAQPRLALRLVALYGQRLHDLHEQLHAVISERARTRIARLILRFMAREGPALRTVLPHQVLARMAGITYEECVRIIGEWSHAADPLLDYGRGGHIVVRNPAALAALAEGLEPAETRATS
jgi:CRP-like cAMP-binding protein